MTSAQLILVSVSSALIAVIAMLVVATVLRARTRESTGGDVPQSTGPQTRAQRAATRAQKKAQRATIKAERKAAKAAASVAKAEKAKAEKAKAAALVAAKTESTDDMSPSAEVSERAPDDKDAKSEDLAENEPGAPKGESPGEKAPSSSVTEAAEIPGAAGETDVLAVPEKKEDEVATTEAGKRASEAKPRARRSLMGRRGADDDSPEETS
jgi:colicin import membrane protein